jgi:hypothetical protein
MQWLVYITVQKKGFSRAPEQGRFASELFLPAAVYIENAVDITEISMYYIWTNWMLFMQEKKRFCLRRIYVR